jgi:hypothetical protein
VDSVCAEVGRELWLCVRTKAPALLLLFILPVACTPAVAPNAHVAVSEPAIPPPLSLPALVVTTPRTTVVAAQGSNTERVAKPTRRLPVTVREQHGDSMLVEISGPIDVVGTVPLAELGVLVCEPHAIGEHFYAAKENLLYLRSGLENGRVKVHGEVTARVDGYMSPKQQLAKLSFDSDVDAQRLCTAMPPPRHAGTEEDPTIAVLVGSVNREDFPEPTALVDLKGESPLPLLSTPGGAPLLTFAAGDWRHSLVHMRREGDWDLVAAGSGPYVLGWIPARSEPRRQQGGFVGGVLADFTTRPGPMALRTKALLKLPLHTIRAGTQVSHFDAVYARFNQEGLARVAARQERWAYVVAAVDDDLTVEGWVATEQLGEQVTEAVP